MASHIPKVFGVILKGYPRLSETFILNEIYFLEQSGCEIHIFALRNPGESKVHDRVHEVRAGVTYIPDSFWSSFLRLLTANLILLAMHPKRYLPALSFALRRSLRRRSSSTIKRFLQAGYLVSTCPRGIDIGHFHAHFSHGPTTVAYFASRLSGLNYSFSAHAKDIYLQEDEFLREKMQNASFVVTCTEFNRNHLLGIGDGKTPVHRSYHGADLLAFTRSKKGTRNPAPGVPRILSVGRFVPKKGFPILLAALSILKKRPVPFHCQIVGGGPLLPRLQEIVQDLGLQDHVELLPSMDQKELMEHYRKADLFALACEIQANGDRDGIPNVLVEAMAMEIPVVSTSVSGIPELVENEQTGLLVPEKNPEMLACALEVLLLQPHRRKELGRNGRLKVEQEFDTVINVQRIKTLLPPLEPKRRQA